MFTDASRLVVGSAGEFCGWPANHGSWQRGDEWLFGFAYAQYDPSPGKFHKLHGPIIKKLARSLDAGKTWMIETSNVDFEGEYPVSGPFEFVRDKTILRFCGRYDHGGEFCSPEGAVYVSQDFGRYWSTGYTFSDPSPEGLVCTTRTCVVDDFVFLSYADPKQWGSDRVIVCRISDGSIAYVSTLDSDGVRAVMPSAVRDPHNGDFLIAVRHREAKNNWITLHRFSPDNLHWEQPSRIIAHTGESNGNPPALALVGDVLVCAYGVRSLGHPRIELSASNDMGRTWEVVTYWRQPNSDMGYPRIFLRDGRSLSIVYYRDEMDRATIRIIDTTI